jgi:hypothetical protein
VLDESVITVVAEVHLLGVCEGEEDGGRVRVKYKNNKLRV